MNTSPYPVPAPPWLEDDIDDGPDTVTLIGGWVAWSGVDDQDEED